MLPNREIFGNSHEVDFWRLFCLLLLLGIRGVALLENSTAGFLPSAYAFYIAGNAVLSLLMGPSGGREARASFDGNFRRFLDSLIEVHDNPNVMGVTSRENCPVHWREAMARLAQLYFMRSHTKLTKQNDMAGGAADLDLAVKTSPDTRARLAVLDQLPR